MGTTGHARIPDNILQPAQRTSILPEQQKAAKKALLNGAAFTNHEDGLSATPGLTHVRDHPRSA
jgi:hypothetical protein